MGEFVSLEQFLIAALEPVRNHRKGQHFSNSLYLLRPDLHGPMQEAGLDPFYKDELLWAAIAFVKERWSES